MFTFDPLLVEEVKEVSELPVVIELDWDDLATDTVRRTLEGVTGKRGEEVVPRNVVFEEERTHVAYDGKVGEFKVEGEFVELSGEMTGLERGEIVALFTFDCHTVESTSIVELTNSVVTDFEHTWSELVAETIEDRRNLRAKLVLGDVDQTTATPCA